jgi:anti-sigma regulatory factor (Ser/Thr protein kinase)
MIPDASPPPEIEIPFGRATVAPSAARAALRSILPQDDDVLATDAELVASELVTNVVRHTDGRGLLRAWRVEGGVRIEVVDDDDRLPFVEAPAPTEPGGRGLLLVDRVATQWGVEPQPVGKRVWAEVRRP